MHQALALPPALRPARKRAGTGPGHPSSSLPAPPSVRDHHSYALGGAPFHFLARGYRLWWCNVQP
jgi:hypothetical protein